MKSRSIWFYPTTRTLEKFAKTQFVRSRLTMDKITHESSPVLAQIYAHPFNQHLYQGSLPILTFKSYIEQDKWYLQKFAQSLEMISERLDQQRHKLIFKKFSQNMLETERKLQEKYLRKLLPNSLFNQSKTIQPHEIPVIAEYTNYLRHKAQYDFIEEAVASHLPCFYIYMKLGERMSVEKCEPNNPYLDWIRSYSSPQFKLSTQQIMETFNELIEDVRCEERQKKIVLSFAISTKYEHAFFEAIFAKQGYVISSSDSKSFLLF